jgi:type II secretory pathway pseudopilin PulG
VKRRLRAPAHSAPRNRGFALIAFVLLLVLVAGYVVAAALNRTSSELASTREDRNMKALRQAKAALIAYAASEEWQLYKALPSTPPAVYVQPGSLPCPDQNNDGDADCFGSLTASMLGRLPWGTIGADDLRDASGERLWYALSHDFRKNQCPGTGCTTINSDTQGQLTIRGPGPAYNVVTNKVVAIVFAPGLSVQGQLRNSANINNAASYLEDFDLSDPVNFKFTTDTLPSSTFNDRLLAITQAELMAAVEPVVAARIERDIKPYIQAQFAGWSNAYPFAMPFLPGGPGQPQPNYKGVAGQDNGLLPLTTDTSLLLWKSGSVGVTAIPGGGTGNQSFSYTCSIQNSGTLIHCVINYGAGSSDRPAIQLQATLLNAGLGFVKPVAQADKIMTDSAGNPTDWSSLTPTTPSVTNVLLGPLPNPDTGNGRVTFTGGLRNGASTGSQVTIDVPVPGYHSLTNSATLTSGWFIANQWYRQTYYAVSPGYLPGGGGNCIPSGTPPPPLCLTVNKLPLPSNNKLAVLVLAGRALNGVVRPTTTLSDYFENANLTAANGTTPYVYEQRIGTPTAINDRVVVMAP